MSNLRRWAAVGALGLLTVYEAHAAGALWGWQSLVFGFFAVAVAVAALGVAKRQFWARWLAMGIGLAGVIDAMAYLSFLQVDGGFVGFVAICGSVPLLLFGKRMRDHFAESQPSPLWQLPDWRVTLMALSVVASVAMVAGLLRYATNGAWWVGSDDRTVALVTAALLAAGAVGTMLGRVWGLLVMFACSCAALGLATESAFRLNNPLCGSYGYLEGLTLQSSLAGFVPGALLAVAVTIVMAGPMIRFLRRS